MAFGELGTALKILDCATSPLLKLSQKHSHLKLLIITRFIIQNIFYYEHPKLNKNGVIRTLKIAFAVVFFLTKCLFF